MDGSAPFDKPEEVSKQNEQLTFEQHEFLKEVEKDAAKQEATEETQEEAKKVEDSKYDFYTENGYVIDPKIGLVFNNSKIISGQRTLVFSIIRRAGSNLFHGKSVMNAPLPIDAFEPRSTLERVATLCCYMPQMLLPLAEVTDPVERLKRMMAWAVATMHLGIGQQKPFPCGLGETMQARIGDLYLYGEHVTEHPPEVLAIGKDFRLHGNYEIAAFTYPNSIKIKTCGRRVIEFTGKAPAQYVLILPEISIAGIMMGKREFRYQGSIIFEDLTNNMYAQIRMNPDKKGFFAGLFSKQTYREDRFKGFITKNKALLDEESSSVFNSKDIISMCEGNWIDNIYIDGKLYWEMGRTMPAPIVRLDNLLPSDTSFRDDINALANGNSKEAQILLDSFEENERRDKKLREEGAKKRKAASKKK